MEGRSRGQTCPPKPDFLRNIPDWNQEGVESSAEVKESSPKATPVTRTRRAESSASPGHSPVVARRSNSISSPSNPRSAKTELLDDAPLGAPVEAKPTVSKTGKSIVANRYHPGDELGKGAFARVYRGLDIETGSVVAIKQVDKHALSERDMERIRQELDLLQRLSHPNIVKLLDYQETDDYFNFVLDYIEGGSLHGLKNKYGNFPEPLLGAYVSQTLEGLAYLHSENVVHRDIKGANILITKGGICKLADFGSCSSALRNNKMTMIGTPFWMAPELISQSGGGLASDIWSLACTMIELFTGQPPYWKLGPNVALFRMVEDAHPPLPEKMSPELEEFFQKCFIKDEKARASCEELLRDPWIVKYKKKEKVVAQEEDKQNFRTPRRRLFNMDPSAPRPGFHQSGTHMGASIVSDKSMVGGGAPGGGTDPRKLPSRMTSSPNLARRLSGSASEPSSPKLQKKNRVASIRISREKRKSTKEKEIDRTIKAWVGPREEKKSSFMRSSRASTKRSQGSNLKKELSGEMGKVGEESILRNVDSYSNEGTESPLMGSATSSEQDLVDANGNVLSPRDRNLKSSGPFDRSEGEESPQSSEVTPRLDSDTLGSPESGNSQKDFDVEGTSGGSDEGGGQSVERSLAKSMETSGKLHKSSQHEREEEAGGEETVGRTKSCDSGFPKVPAPKPEPEPEAEAGSEPMKAKERIQHRRDFEKRQRINMELQNIEMQLQYEVEYLGQELNEWRTKLRGLVNEKVELEMVSDELRTEIQKLILRKEKLVAKRDFLKDFAAQQQSECDMLEHEIRAFLRRLQDEMTVPVTADTVAPSQASIRWIMPGAQCQARHSDTHKWDDAVITGQAREIGEDDVYYTVIFIGSGSEDRLRASDIKPPSSHWVPEEMRKSSQHKRTQSSFFKKSKKKKPSTQQS
mmetsp:Transcript_12025/g.33891  ORF Transcript_12025/g.33891 Transcript_12025/m.33891 type:complete len:919 (+) Transcript_12025:231-2987(+)